MAHIGQELALGFSCRLRPGLGLAKVLLKFPPPGHVPEVEDGGPRPAAGIPDRPGEALQPDLIGITALAQEPELALQVPVFGVIVEDAVEKTGRRPVVGGQDVVREGFANHGLRGVSKAFHRGGRIEDLTARADPEHDVGDVIGKQPKPGFALRQRRFPHPRLGDVHGNAKDRRDLPVLPDLCIGLGEEDPLPAIPEPALRLDPLWPPGLDDLGDHVEQSGAVVFTVQAGQVLQAGSALALIEAVDLAKPGGEGRYLVLEVDPEVAGARQLLGQHGDLVGFPRLPGAVGDFGGRLLPSAPPVDDGGTDHHEDDQNEDQVRKVRHDAAEVAAAGVPDGAPDLEVNSRQQGRRNVHPESDGPQRLHDDLLGEQDGDRPHSEDLRWPVETRHQPHADEAEGRDEDQLDDDPNCAPGISRQGSDNKLVGDD